MSQNKDIFEKITDWSVTLFGGLFVAWMFASVGSEEEAFKLLDMPHLIPTIMSFSFGFLAAVFLWLLFIKIYVKKISWLYLGILFAELGILFLIPSQGLDILSKIYNIIFPTLLGLFAGTTIFFGIAYITCKKKD